jgi:hypothetical protein
LAALILLAASTAPPSPEAALFGHSPGLTWGGPTWYVDRNPTDPAALALEVCLSPDPPVGDGLCVLPLAGDEPDYDPALPLVLAPPPASVNFPAEPFYFLAEATMGLSGGGAASLRLALEFAFGGGAPVDGDQITFNRFRARIDAPVTGRYRITHPWGTYEQDVLALGPGNEINFTEDVGCFPCIIEVPPLPPISLFHVAQDDASPTRITGPFLRWDTGFPVIGASGARYIGDPLVPHTVIGSVVPDPLTPVQFANLFRVEVDTNFNGTFETVLGETDQFFVMGRLLAGLLARNDQATTPANTDVTIAVLANDQPNLGQTLALASVTIVPGSEVGGTAAPQPDGTVVFTPALGFTGAASFRYTVNDTTPATSNEATVTIAVTAPPVANPDNATTGVNTPVNINVAANDTDSDGTVVPGSILIATTPTQGTVQPNNPLPGWIRYTPNPGAIGLDTFTYTINDNLGAVSAPGLVSVTVVPGPTVDITSASLGLLRLFASGSASKAPGAIGPPPPFAQLFAGLGLPTGPGCGGMTFIGNARVNRLTGFWRFAILARTLRFRLGGALPTHICAQIPGGGSDIWPF